MTDQSKTEYDDKIAEIKEQEYQLCQQREGLEQLRAELLCPFKVGDVLTDKKGSKAVLKRRKMFFSQMPRGQKTL